MGQSRARHSARKPACFPEQLCSIGVGAPPHSSSSSAAGAVGEETADDRELLRRGEVRRAGERDLLVVEVRPRPHHGERLDRLCRRAKVRDERGIAGGELDAPVPDGHRVHDVARLDDLAAGHLDDDRLHGREPR